MIRYVICDLICDMWYDMWYDMRYVMWLKFSDSDSGSKKTSEVLPWSSHVFSSYSNVDDYYEFYLYIKNHLLSITISPYLSLSFLLLIFGQSYHLTYHTLWPSYTTGVWSSIYFGIGELECGMYVVFFQLISSCPARHIRQAIESLFKLLQIYLGRAQAFSCGWSWTAGWGSVQAHRAYSPPKLVSISAWGFQETGFLFQCWNVGWSRWLWQWISVRSSSNPWWSWECSWAVGGLTETEKHWCDSIHRCNWGIGGDHQRGTI